MSRPRLLFIAPRFLFPLDDSGRIRTVGLLRAMQGGAFDVTLASPAPANSSEFKAELAGVADRFISWPAVPAGALRRGMAALGRLPAAAAAVRSANGRAAVKKLLGTGPDVVVADFPHSAVLLPRKLKIPSVVVSHGVEAEILQRQAAEATGWRRHARQRDADKMAAFERRALRQFDTVVTIAERDAKLLANRYQIQNLGRIETGVDLEYYAFQPPRPRADTVVFWGAMDNRRNTDAIEFLLRDVWPMVAASRPAARMRVVGRNPPPALIAEAALLFRSAWRFTGLVEDIRPHLQLGDIAVMPLRLGSGTRLKAFEALASGLPLVSTSLGVEGLGLEQDEHYLTADRAELFAQAIVRLLDDSAARQRLAESGRALLEARFSWPVIARQFETICQRTIAAAGQTNGKK